MKTTNKKFGQQGFTIVELMIATAVFSIVLLVASAGIIAIGKSYYKSLTSTRVHEAVRSAMDDISGSLQFSDTDSVAKYPADATPATIRVRCFGPDRYTYILNQPVKGGQHALYRDRRTSQTTCQPSDFTNGSELLGDNMRLLDFYVSDDVPFQVDIKVAYGDNDLLSNYPDNANDSTPPIASVPFSSVECKSGIAGSNFCATAGLETTVTSRVE